jgi:hypothetical protein
MNKENVLDIIKKCYTGSENKSLSKHSFCNFTGLDIGNNEYISYSSGEKYIWKYFIKYINFIFQKYENLLIIQNDNDIIVKNNKLNIVFDLTFHKSFHIYIDTPYPRNIRKYLIYGTYADPLSTMPYFRTSELRSMKNEFNHGDIVSTGDSYYILKNETFKKRTWKECSTDSDDNLCIEYSYVQSRGYLYYIGLMKFFKISYLPLDINREEFINLITGDIYVSNPNQYYEDDIVMNTKSNPFLDVNKDENKEFNNTEINRKFGEIIMNNDKYFIKLDETHEVALDENIARQFITIKGYNYYYKICKEFENEWKCMISPFEVLNLYTLEINKIKIG